MANTAKQTAIDFAAATLNDRTMSDPLSSNSAQQLAINIAHNACTDHEVGSAN